MNMQLKPQEIWWQDFCFVLVCFASFILYALPSRTDSRHKLNGQLFTAEKFRGRKTVVALLLTFPMPELWKNWTDWCHEWCILSKDAITVFHIALPPQEKAKPACTALQHSFPHFPSALFFFFLTSFYARSSQVSFLSHWNKKGSFPFTAKVPWTSHTSLPFAKRKAVLNCRVSSTLQYKFQSCGTATFLSLQECSECSQHVSTKSPGYQETFQNRSLPSHNWTWVTFVSCTCTGIEPSQVTILKYFQVQYIGMRLSFCVIYRWSDYFAV